MSKMDDIRFENLPTELLLNITEHLLGARAFGSVVSFALCNSRLRGVLPLLYRNVGRVNLDAGEDALIWATENDELEVLKLLLESGVDPNARLWSCLPDFARQDVFAAQRVRPRLAPRLDGHFIAKLLQEDIVHFENKFTVNPGRSSEEALMFREWYRATVNGDIPEDLDVSHGIDELVKRAHFGCRLSAPDWNIRTRNQEDLYFWSALHIATKQGNDRAVELLIAHGADIESRCRGLCDCIPPVHSAGWLPPPSYGPLHIAVCSGRQHLAHIFLARGANLRAAGETVSVGGFPTADFNKITVFHAAALQGNTSMCQFLFDHHTARGPGDPTHILKHQDSNGLCALDYAVLTGHMRTAGNWLYDRGVGPHPPYDSEVRSPASLNFLCHHGLYRDAHSFLDRIWPSPQICTVALQSCFLRVESPSMSVVSILGSLRTYFDEYMAVGVLEQAHFFQPDGEEALVCLIRQLLDRGANPSSTLNSALSSNFPGAFGKSALHLAAGRGQRAALQVMLDAGAPIETYADVIPLYNGHVPGGTPLTPLGCATLPPNYSPLYNDPRGYLETIILLLERGASFRNSLARTPSNNSSDWVFPFFSGNLGGVPWYNLDRFDLFERVMDLVAKDLGQERLPTPWLTDLMTIAITCRNSNGNFCRWLVQRYGIVFTDLSDSDLARLSPADPMYTPRYKPGNMDLLYSGPGPFAAGLMNTTLYKPEMMDLSDSDIARLGPDDPKDIPRYKPEMVDFLLDFIGNTAFINNLHGTRLNSVTFYIRNGLFITLAALINRGLVFARRGTAASDDRESDQASVQLNHLRRQCRTIIMEASRWFTREGALELIRAVLSQLPKIGLGHHPNRLLHNFNEHRLVEGGFNEHAISRVVSKYRLTYQTASLTPRITLVLRELLQQTSPLYGVAGRRHGENPFLPRQSWNFPKIHPFVYPIPVAVEMGRWDLLKVMLTKTSPPQPYDILETLAMALDTTYREVNPTGIRVILQHSPVDIMEALIPRPLTEAETGNKITGHVSPLYYLLKTFYNAHVMPRIETRQRRRPLTHECKCVMITKDNYLVECVALLVKHGASWTQLSLPSHETPLDVLAAILDGKDCRHRNSMWPTHNWNTLRRHVKLDWRAADVAGRELGEGFNPVEFARLGVEASWGQEVAGLVEGGGEMGNE